MVWIRTDILLVLIWVQNVCLSYQQMTKMAASKTLKCVLLTNSDDTDEIPHIVAFHQGQNCLQRRKSNFRERKTCTILKGAKKA